MASSRSRVLPTLLPEFRKDCHGPASTQQFEKFMRTRLINGQSQPLKNAEWVRKKARSARVGGSHRIADPAATKRSTDRGDFVDARSRIAARLDSHDASLCHQGSDGLSKRMLSTFGDTH